MHRSWLLPEGDCGVNVGKTPGSSTPGKSVSWVGKAGAASVGDGAGLAVSVGGIGVLVGKAC